METNRWLARYTQPDTRYIRTHQSLAEAVECRVCRDDFGKELLFFALVGNIIRVVVSDGTVDLIREDFIHWSDAINFARGILGDETF